METAVKPEVGAELVNPKAGTRTVFTATAASTGGSYVEVHASYPPDGRRPPLHLHSAQDEDFTVLAGQLRVVRGDETFSVRAGDAFAVPRGVPHQMWSDGDDGALLRWRTTPALRTDEMYCALFALAREHDWAPPLDERLALVLRFTAEFRLR
ncbi:MAG TPA: cupin domain-containing protein [Frankiaceae bacterium]|nr:cupin domain-containing protein [Frankiaceae bacterium]